MLAKNEHSLAESEPFLIRDLCVEGHYMSVTRPESDLWNAVLLQFLKEAEHLKRDLKRTDYSLNDKSSGARQRGIAFEDHVELLRRERGMKTYIRTNDFHTVCDFAGHNVDCVVVKIIDILEGRLSITDNQVKRAFSRKPEPGRKKVTNEQCR